MNQPDFQIIGAQKSGSTWLWEMLRQHPAVAFPLLEGRDRLSSSKESFFFSDAEEYERGLEYYYQRFDGLRTPGVQVVGEATTDYLFDVQLYQNQVVVDDLPPIPELITRELPHIKVFVVLRNPVSRALSAYYHHLTARRFHPGLSLRAADLENPKMRIISRGFYARYLRLWQQYLPAEQMRIYIFEEDVVRQPEKTVRDAFAFLDVDPSFIPQQPDQSRNKRRGWTHILWGYYGGRPYDFLYRTIQKTPLGTLLDRIDVAKQPPLPAEDIAYLNELYAPDITDLQEMLGRQITSWNQP